MLGRSCAASAPCVAPGMAFCCTNIVLAPVGAGQAAAGIAYGARSPVVTITLSDGLPLRAEKKRSIAAASSYGSLPLRLAGLKPLGARGFGPTSTTCAPFVSWEPFGLSRLSVSVVTSGRPLPSDSSVGPRTGAAFSTDAARAPCQSSLSTSATTEGRERSLVAGHTALTAPATSAAASPPLTRVVFLVATVGKPSSAAARGWLDLTPVAGVPGSGAAVPPESSFLSL